MPVPTRRFGRTELAMPVLTGGGMRYQEDWGDLHTGEISDANQANAEATVRRALGDEMRPYLLSSRFRQPKP